MAWAEAYLRMKFHLDPSNRLATNNIHQCYRVDRQTNRTDRQRFDGIGQTVLQTVAQKLDLKLVLVSRVGSALPLCAAVKQPDSWQMQPCNKKPSYR